MVMITGQEPCLLQSRPALGLEIRALRTRSMPAGVVPDARHMPIRTRLHMAPERRRATLHDGTRRFPDVGRQRVGLFVGWKGVLKDRLERDESHQCLRTHGSSLGL